MKEDTVKDPKLKQILEQMAPFGFQFYAFSEDGTPLVAGPNGQVVEVNIAIQFVNEQIQKQRESEASESSPENIPENMPNMQQGSVEKAVETSIETSIESAIERKQESADSSKTARSQNELKVKATAPSISLPKPNIKPYGDGFDPKSFDPSDIKKTVAFIEKNSKKRNSSSEKWMAVLFRKFIEEVVTQRPG